MSRAKRKSPPIAEAVWTRDAACAQPEHRELFWSVNDRPAGHVDPTLRKAITQARHVCFGCPVMVECRLHAETSEERVYGIWGGHDYGVSWRTA